VIARQSTFPIPVLRQTPAGTDRVTAAAARGGFLRLTAQGGLEWLPLGSRLVDRLRHLLSGQVLPSGPLDGNRQLSPLLDSFRSEALGGDERSQVAFADWGRRDGTARSLKDTSGLGVLEWAAISSNAEQGRAALSEVEGRLVEVLGKCGLAVQLGEGGRDRTLWSYPETACGTPFLRCGDCGYLAEASTARFALPASVTGSPEPMRSVPTPGAKTIRLLCEQLGVTPASTLKALFLTTAQGETVLAVIRGDLDASLDKLGLEIGTEGLRPSTSEEVTRLGVVAGYAGPVGLPVRPDRRGEGVWVVADRSIVESVNLVAGANQEGVHITGVNYPRDFRVTETFDFATLPVTPPARCAEGACRREGLVLAQKRVSMWKLGSISPQDKCCKASCPLFSSSRERSRSASWRRPSGKRASAFHLRALRSPST
jgi:prolyl-tRNA editing enzyme YbaK/EbsC (Cys-tRNA(Pro) deacylase)